MSFADAVKTCFSKYADFSGRARRSEYWFFYLFVFLIVVAGSIVDGIIGTTPVVQVVAVLAVLLPLLAALVRRLHDTGRSGWWALLGLVPFGGLVILVFTVMDSGPDNEYGPSPKGAQAYGATPATDFGTPPGGYGTPPTG